jgi:hypothetical protein
MSYFFASKKVQYKWLKVIKLGLEICLPADVYLVCLLQTPGACAYRSANGCNYKSFLDFVPVVLQTAVKFFSEAS